MSNDETLKKHFRIALDAYRKDKSLLNQIFTKHGYPIEPGDDPEEAKDIVIMTLLAQIETLSNTIYSLSKSMNNAMIILGNLNDAVSKLNESVVFANERDKSKDN